MINRKILLMILFSFSAHLAVAAAIVYTPYEVTGNSRTNHHETVIWGYVGGGEKSAKQGKLAPTMSRRPTKDDEYPVRHPELVSGSPGNETPKPVRDDRTDREAVFSGEMGIPASAIMITENVLAEGQKGDKGVTSVQSEISATGDKNICSTSINCESEDLSIGNPGSNKYDMIALSKYIRKEIERHKYYPDIAKSRGIEGTVYINFFIGQDGTPSSISVARSSGSGILDDAGVKTIRMMDKISDLHKELRELDIVVPITYKLEK